MVELMVILGVIAAGVGPVKSTEAVESAGPVKSTEAVESAGPVESAGAVESSGSTAAHGAEDESRPITYEKIRQISLDINRLTGPKLMEIVKIMKARQPALHNHDSDEFEIDFSVLEPATVREIDRYLDSCLPERPRYNEYEFSEEEDFDPENMDPEFLSSPKEL